MIVDPTFVVVCREEFPESDEEIASAEQLSRVVLAEEPWE
jgi:hypothetical protein